MGLPRRVEEGGPRDPGEESLEEAILAFFKGFGLVRPSLPPWGPVNQEKLDEDLFLDFLLPRNR